MSVPNEHLSTPPLPGASLQQLHALLDGLSPAQIAWVSGYLAGVVHRERLPAAPSADSQAARLTVLYGSQTGNGREIAERLADDALSRGLRVRVLSMGEYRYRELSKEALLLLVVSTHGEGEPPDDAYALHDLLHSARAPRLERLCYAVLGLGDSSYDRFCQTARDFDERLAALGATRVIDRVDCDVDYRARVEDWSGTALDEAARRLPGARAQVVSLPDIHSGRARRACTKYSPGAARLTLRQRLTTQQAVADVRHLVLGVEPGTLSYRPGDALGVWFHNEPALVDAVLTASGLDGSSPVTLEGKELELAEALTTRLELTRLHPSTVRDWAAFAVDSPLPERVQEDGYLQDYIAARDIVDLLREFPGRPDARALAGLLQPLAPRLYSIASSQAEYEDEVHLTVGVVRYNDFGRDYLGGCSGYLAERLEEGANASVYVSENPAFHLPDDGAAPIIMIGAGTGIAPFRAFLQQRALQGDPGPNWLIFGNRNFHQDFLYQTEWQRYRRSGLLNRVDLAFSRDTAHKVYVQDRVAGQAAEIYRWLEDGAHLYLCGSVSMGQAVQGALEDAVCGQAGLTPPEARTYIENLRRQGRYHRDVY
jgi:sulfite reductase (NADPH) flavoprotein alpha-component